MEMEKMRQRSIEFGFLTLAVYLDMKMQNEELKNLLNREFWSLLEDDDYVIQM
jgi:hypothetical protein